ncbi:alpha/beta fold hydrolase [Microbacterium terricola]|uniref:Alpha/beta hydrolase n=1 Tax=Microbacterium terricola TaxID=344163 RepID=A0ABM8E285_9MICO|nr:alpha/beta hydrolase [Microbacterium terricola]UYK40402.1 alpha/beta hydrolase [Microbacterium terricola]BDV31880.1 alpha/beta hydrolase [Microbacterium terricola]
MSLIESADGTSIAVHEVGSGPAVVIVNGAFSTAKDAVEIADAFAGAGLRAVTYDRRARGDSGDTPPVDPLREVEDLAAVIASVGGVAAVIGHSSGAVLALYAAGEGVPVGRLLLSEPPFHFGEDEPDAALPERLQALVDAGEEAEAVLVFQREGIGLPEEMIEQIRTSPLFDSLVPLAQSTVYDATLTRQVSTPTAEMRQVEVPVTILCGVQTFPLLTGAARRLAEAMPAAEFLEVPESVGHRLDPAAATRIVAERLQV